MKTLQYVMNNEFIAISYKHVTITYQHNVRLYQRDYMHKVDSQNEFYSNYHGKQSEKGFQLSCLNWTERNN